MTYGTRLSALAWAGAVVGCLLFLAAFSLPAGAQGSFALNVWLRAELDNGQHVGDYANRIRFENDARIDWDQHDSTKPMPPKPTRNFVLLSPAGVYHDTPIRQAVRSLPSDLEWVLTIPIAFQSTGDGSFEVLMIPSDIPEGWSFELRDMVTQDAVDIPTTEESSYGFSSGAVGDWEGRFELIVNPPGGVVNTPPEVSILGPEDGADFPEGEDVTFSAIAEDPEEGDLSENLQWTSSLDGPIGIGATFATSGLSVGNHTITASVVDSGNATGLGTIDLAIEGAVGTEDDPAAFRLTHAVPNPASGSTSLALRVSNAQHVAARVYDALGRVVATLHEGLLAAGEDVHLEVDTAPWAAGTYVVRVEGETFVETRRFAVVR